MECFSECVQDLARFPFFLNTINGVLFQNVYLKILLGARFRDIGHEQLGLRLVLGLLALSI
jgi:hypothetical protein